MAWLLQFSKLTDTNVGGAELFASHGEANEFAIFLLGQGFGHKLEVFHGPVFNAPTAKMAKEFFLNGGYTVGQEA